MFAYKDIFCQISFSPTDVGAEAAINITNPFVDLITS